MKQGVWWVQPSCKNCFSAFYINTLNLTVTKVPSTNNTTNARPPLYPES